MQYHVTTSSSNAVSTQFELNKRKLKTIAVSLVLSKPAMTKQKIFSFTGIFKRTIARVTHNNRLKKSFFNITTLRVTASFLDSGFYCGSKNSDQLVEQ